MGKEYDNGLPGGKHIDLRLRHRIEAAVHRNARLPKKDRLSQNKLAAALAYLIKEEHLSPYCALMRLKEQGWENLPCPRTIYNHLKYGDLHINREKLPYKPRGQKGKPKSPPAGVTQLHHSSVLRKALKSFRGGT